MAGGADVGNSTLRGRLRAEIHQALKPSAASARLAALGAELDGLLCKAPRSRKASASAAAKGASGACVSLEEVERELPEEPTSEEDAPEHQHRKLVLEEATAAMIRDQVAEAKRRLHDLDGLVTNLTRSLKGSRSKLWGQQMLNSSVEARITAILKTRAAELDREVLQEEQRLQKEEQQLRQSLVEARGRASRWFADAKHQDGILQQERDAAKGGDAHRILAKHPAGEVFLPTFPSDNDSDDDYYPEGPRSRPPPPAATAAARGPTVHRSADSSDDDDDSDQDYKAPRGGGARPVAARQDSADSDKDPTPPPPPPVARQFRATRDDDDSSDGSSLPSPAGEHAPPLKPLDAPRPEARAATTNATNVRDADEVQEVTSEEGIDDALDSSRSL